MVAGRGPGRLRRVLTVLLVIVAIVGLAMLWWENRQIATELKTTQRQLETEETLRQEAESALEVKQQEVETLAHEKQALGDELEQVRVSLAQSGEELEAAKERLTALETYNLNLAKDVALLTQTKATLESQVKEIAQERQRLEERLHSLTELRKAIREVKHEMHAKKVTERRKQDQEDLETGNRGYLVFQQQSTLGSRVKIQVLPAAPSVEP